MDNDQLKDEMEKWWIAMELRLTDKIFGRLDKLETRLVDRIEAMENLAFLAAIHLARCRLDG